ncbi:DUF3558 domain-containing protein, partial [Mycolicibacterium canariasense]
KRLSISIPACMAAVGIAVAATGCMSAPAPLQPQPAASEEFDSGECNLVTDTDVTRLAGPDQFAQVLVSDAGCFWQENSLIDTIGAGMGISTWWYRGSSIDTELGVERLAGRSVTEVTIGGRKGFQASDANACSVYVAKGDDVITWSIQTLNPSALPDLCTVVGRLAQFTQERVD